MKCGDIAILIFNERVFAMDTHLFPIPSIFFVLKQDINMTIQTQSVMTADRTATLWTHPLCRFLLQEFFYPILLYEFEICYHAHVIFCAIAFIQRF